MSDFSITYTDTEEISHLRDGFAESLRVQRIKNKIGTLLLHMLNCDMDALVKKISDHCPPDPWPKTADDFMKITPPAEDVFLSIGNQFPFIRSFFCDDWTRIFLEVVGGDGRRTLPDAIADIKEIIDATKEKPKYWNCSLLDGYIFPNISNFEAHYKRYTAEIWSSNILCGLEQASPEFDNEYGDYIPNLLDAAYKSFANQKDACAVVHTYEDMYPRLETIAYASVIELARLGKSIRKCKLCGKYFIPEKRSDTLYCKNQSIQDEKLTCKEYAASRLSYLSQRSDEVSKLSRNILSKKQTIASRHPETVWYKESYDYYRYHRKLWLDKIAKNPSDKSLVQKYHDWLKIMNATPLIKEAKGFVYPSK